MGPERRRLEGLRKEGFKAVFLAAGTQKSRRLFVEGEDLEGVLPALDFLRSRGRDRDRPSAAVKGKVVAVIGGGNTAIDSVRTARRLGAKKALLVYRRTRDEMPAQAEEVEAAEAEGIELHFLLAPAKIEGKNGKVGDWSAPGCAWGRRTSPTAGVRCRSRARSETFRRGRRDRRPGPGGRRGALRREGGRSTMERGLLKADPVDPGDRHPRRLRRR